MMGEVDIVVHDFTLVYELDSRIGSQEDVRCFCQRGYKGRRLVPGGRRESRRSWR
jgi:hypothetical protein